LNCTGHIFLVLAGATWLSLFGGKLPDRYRALGNTMRMKRVPRIWSGSIDRLDSNLLSVAFSDPGWLAAILLQSASDMVRSRTILVVVCSG
jgi:hypothetical protein